MKNNTLYKDTTDMIKAAIRDGFKHIGGKGLRCKECGHKSSVRKFIKNKCSVYACNKCGARYGDVPDKAKDSHKQLELPFTALLTTPPDDGDTVDEYSELKVLSSGAGYYIGRIDEYGAPYSRESGYYPTFDAAAKALVDEFEVRDCAENNHAYDSGTLPDIRK